MKSKKWMILCASLIFLSNCSSKTGLNGLGGASSEIGFGEISESSIEYFTQNIGDTVLFSVDQSALGAESIQVLQEQASWLNENTGSPIIPSNKYKVTVASPILYPNAIPMKITTNVCIVIGTG